MKVSGDLDSEGSVQIEGNIQGDVCCAEVTVGNKAYVQGLIQAETASIHGTVKGEIRAARVTLSATARVTGNIIHEELSIDAGACIDGQMMRRDIEQSRPNLVVGETS